MVKRVEQDFKIGDKVRHNSREWYQKCTVIEIEEGCNGGIIAQCEDSPIYKPTMLPQPIGFTKAIERFCPQDLVIV